MFSLDVNKINCRYFSRGTQLELYKDSYLELLPPEKLLFPKYVAGGDEVLDLGCGAGRTTVHLHQLAGRVLGTDLSEVMVATAREKYPELEFRAMDASALDLPERSVDVVVFSYNGLCYLHPEEKRLTALREIWRVLRPGGRFIFSSFNRYPPLTLSALLNIAVTKVLLGFRSNYKIHLTRYGITVNYETSPADETRLLEGMGFVLEEQVPMTEKVGMLGYRPQIATYYVFRKP